MFTGVLGLAILLPSLAYWGVNHKKDDDAFESVELCIYLIAGPLLWAGYVVFKWAVYGEMDVDID